MVNGHVGLAIVIGGFVLTAITLIGIVLLVALHNNVPMPLYTVLTTLLGFLLGATGVTSKTSNVATG
jgi:hypothetical protein